MMGTVARLGLGFWLCAVGAGCGATDPRPDVLLVTLDTTRADHVSAYGYPRPTTPALEALAARGVLFENAYAPTATTAPSHATLFTSLYVPVHGVRRNGHRLDAELETLAERLAAEGWDTAAFVSSRVLERHAGFDQGFATYDAAFDPDHSSWNQVEEGAPPVPLDRRAWATTERAVDWLDGRDSGRPFFLWVHYFDPHAPLLPPAAYRERFRSPEPRDVRTRMVDLYDAELRFMDDAMGRLVNAVLHRAGEAGALVAVAGDHGEGLRDHGWDTHGVQLYEEAMRVPLVLAWPGEVPGGVRVPASVGVVDLLPTLAKLLDLAPRADWQGRDLATLWRGRPPVDATPVFLERRLYTSTKIHERDIDGVERTHAVSGPMWAVRRGRWKLIHAPEQSGVELYDLEADPAERRDLSVREPEVVASLLESLEVWRRSNARRSREPVTGVSPDEAARLRALGYAE